MLCTYIKSKYLNIRYVIKILHIVELMHKNHYILCFCVIEKSEVFAMVVEGIGVTMEKIRKRDGRIVDFDKQKIVNAVAKAARVSGEKEIDANEISNKVIAQLSSKNQIPAVEEIQDTVEKILIEGGYAKIAKAYIVYRQQRQELRKEKQIVLEKEEIDEVDKNFDVNALRVLKSRYLRKDSTGRLIETPKQLFTRIAVHTALPDLLYDSRIFDINASQIEQTSENFNPADYDNMLKIGEFSLNKYHLEALKRMYDRFNKDRQMKIGWTRLLRMIESGDFDSYSKSVQKFYNTMTKKYFLPNTPAIANFGNPLGMGSACFVLDVPDSIEGIMETLKGTAIVFKAGGGMGYNFSSLRPEGDFVSTTGGVASGPLSFMRLFDTMTEVIKQGGIRRGANMGILNSNHPDIEKFITAKKGNQALRNFNISVLIMDDFWEYYEKNEPYPLTNPRTKEIVKYVNPRDLFDRMIYQAWESAEPGIIFYDAINKYNPFYEYLGPIVTTNPCGEVLLYPNEPCNLGSINVWAFVKSENGITYFDWDGLREVTRLSTRFLDNVIDVNHFPLKQIEEMSLSTRKIGLGVMGVGDLLYEMRIPYNSNEGKKFMEELMEFVNYWSKFESVELAKIRGKFKFYDKSFYKDGKLPFSGRELRNEWHFDWDKLGSDIKNFGIRNGYTTVIAPTGSISMIAGCSSGMEPVYSLVFEKNVKVGQFFYVDPAFEKVIKEEGAYSEKLMEDINNSKGSVQDIEYVPMHLRSVFVTALDIKPEDHIKALASFQKWVDSAISKTNNFPADASLEYMKQSYILAYKLGCKGVTVFRDSSIKDQVLVAPKKKEKIEIESSHDVGNGESIISKQIKNCPECNNLLDKKEGCALCPSCGWGLCP